MEVASNSPAPAIAATAQGTEGLAQASTSLVKAAAEGDPRAAGDLVRLHWRDAHRAAYLITRDVQLAEDIAQDSLMKVIEKLDSFDCRRPVRPWLHQIVVRRSIDQLRSDKSRAVRERNVASAVATVPVGVSDSELVKALWSLPDSERAVVVLRHVFDYSATEIGSILGESPSTIRSRLQRGLAQLRDLLPEHEGGRP